MPGLSRLTAALFALALLASACTDGDTVAVPDKEEATTTSTEATTTTSTEPTTTTTTEAAFPGLKPGMSGDQVAALQSKLNEIKFPVGTPDGKYGGVTAQAVMAFQKAHGFKRTGNATNEEIAKIMSSGPISPMMSGAEPTRIEFDRDRQILILVVGGSVHSVLNASSGSGKAYCENGYCGDAKTPAGAYKISRRINGWRISPLGKLYNPLYFNGGIAIHGAGSVPAYPASHGCVRINMAAAEWVPGLVPNGTPVYVIAGGKTPTPFNQQPRTPVTQAEPTTTAAPETTTTTAAPTTTTAAPTTTTSAVSP